MRRANIILQCSGRRHVFDTKWNYRDTVMNRSFNLALNLVRAICVRRENQNHTADLLDRLNNRFGIVHARQNIAWRYPTTDTGRFQGCTGGIRSEFISDRVTYEEIDGHLVSRQRFNELIASFFGSGV